MGRAAPSPPFEVCLSIVDWLPPLRLGPRLLFEGTLEALLRPDAALPFARLRADAEGGRFLPDPALHAGLSPVALRAMLDAVPGADLSRAARLRRQALGAALAAAEATEALNRLATGRRWLAAVTEHRGAYLRALGAGSPPPAAEVMAACRTVPHGLRGLGHALPTAEAVRLLAPLGPVCELGAGFGLFARALERAGVEVVATDAGSSAGIGIAFPVRRGLDAAATLSLPEAAGRTALIVWPQFDEGAWFAEVFARTRPGQVLAMASPELEFCLQGGAMDAAAAGPGWRAAAGLQALLQSGFDELGQAPVVAEGWPMVTTPLRLWRRR